VIIGRTGNFGPAEQGVEVVWDSRCATTFVLLLGRHAYYRVAHPRIIEAGLTAALHAVKLMGSSLTISERNPVY
jgi:hypothetical protein